MSERNLRVAVLKAQDYSVWSSEKAQAGGIGPYGLEHLSEYGLDLDWSDGLHRRFFSFPGIKRIRAFINRFAHLRGIENAIVSLRVVNRSDVVLSLFEDQGAGALLLRSARIWPFSRVPHVMVVCWLADEGRRMTPRGRMRMARILRHAAALVVYSNNQKADLVELFGVSADAIFCCSFGVDTGYFLGAADDESPEIDVLAVGRDLSRDYGTLFRAMKGRPARALVVCGEKNVEGATIPDNVAVVSSGVDHAEYRRLLRAAAIVVVPTVGPAYPAGQTVVLEAMACGVPVVTTDSPAMREYIEHDVDGVLVRKWRDDDLWAAVSGLLEDGFRRRRIGLAGKERVVRMYDHSNMWSELGPIIVMAANRRGGG